MLALSRTKQKPDVLLTLPDGREIVVSVLNRANGRVSLGFDAPADVKIRRRELEPEEPQA